MCVCVCEWECVGVSLASVCERESEWEGVREWVDLEFCWTEVNSLSWLISSILKPVSDYTSLWCRVAHRLKREPADSVLSDH